MALLEVRNDGSSRTKSCNLRKFLLVLHPNVFVTENSTTYVFPLHSHYVNVGRRGDTNSNETDSRVKLTCLWKALVIGK